MRPTWIEVDLGAIRHNVAAVVNAVAPAEVCAVVKADGYGHGDVPVAQAALDAGARWLAVALIEEGIRLREAGIEAPVLLLSEPPASAADRVTKWRLTPTVYTSWFVEALEEVAAEAAPFAVHLKVDTGMHRVGAETSTALTLAKRIASSESLTLGGVWTHFAVAEEDDVATATQLSEFRAFVDAVEACGIDPGRIHAANTAGALARDDARFDMIRLGLGMYGLQPSPTVGADLGLRPAMRVVSHVSHIARYPGGTRLSYGLRRPLPADATVATVPVGYADGLARRLSALDAEVLVGGTRVPFAGTITMDQIVLDVGEAPVAIGDEVVLLGAQGADAITAEEWAERLGTINYEIVCRFGPRVPRRYVDGPSRFGDEP